MVDQISLSFSSPPLDDLRIVDLSQGRGPLDVVSLPPLDQPTEEEFRHVSFALLHAIEDDVSEHVEPSNLPVCTLLVVFATAYQWFRNFVSLGAITESQVHWMFSAILDLVAEPLDSFDQATVH